MLRSLRYVFPAYSDMWVTERLTSPRLRAVLVPLSVFLYSLYSSTLRSRCPNKLFRCEIDVQHFAEMYLEVFFSFFPFLSSWVLPRVLRDHSGCGVGRVCRDRIRCVSAGGVVGGAQDGSGCAAVRPRSRLRRVRERQGGGVDDAVVPHQCYGNLYWLPHPSPALTERWNVRHNTQHAFSTPATQNRTHDD